MVKWLELWTLTIRGVSSIPAQGNKILQIAKKKKKSNSTYMKDVLAWYLTQNANLISLSFLPYLPPSLIYNMKTLIPTQNIFIQDKII